jgi:hypothetical protein
MIIDARFAGPPGFTNGGYACGVVAQSLPGPAEVTLRAGVPVGVELQLEGSRLSSDGKLLAEAVAAEVELAAPEPPSLAQAEAAAKAYPGFVYHPYPGCFVCGPKAAGGLHIYPGRVEGRDLAAAPFRPAPEHFDGGLLKSEIVWAALDCPSYFGWAIQPGWEPVPALLGRLAADVRARPRADTPCVAVGWLIERDGRKVHVGSALFQDGQLCAIARGTWILPR